jgi:two-component system, sensor histidine kinase
LGGDRTVLLLDDEEAIRTGVGAQLAECGYAVIVVSTIGEAVAAARAGDRMIDVVISDSRLRRGEAGLRGIEEVRRAWGLDVPGLLVSGVT